MDRDRTIQPAKSLHGTIRLPGDKSISHRYAILASLAEGESEITNYSSGADCAATLDCLRAMGVSIERDRDRVRIQGVGLRGLRRPAAPLDAGNSGTAMRLLAGILAGQPFPSEIGGDESLSGRPMRRVITPLEAMGAKIEARQGGLPPLKIQGGGLRAIDYESPVASAQVKTCVLFAGMFAEGTTSVTEPLKTRNHSEIALAHFGAEVAVDGLRVSIAGGPKLEARKLRVPSDLSSAAFFIGAALMLPGSELRIEGLGLNPTRTALLDVLREMGAALKAEPDADDGGEPTGTLIVRGPASAEAPILRGGVIEGATTAGVIDEVPMLAVLGALSDKGLEVRAAAELRVKETDRIDTVAANLRRMGVEVETSEAEMKIAGRSTLTAAELDSYGDHRIAMAFAVAALRAGGPCRITDAAAASVSFPEFYEILESVVRR